MRILFVTPRLPYLLYKGDQVRTYHFIRELARKGHEIDLVSFIEDSKEKDYLPALKPYCRNIHLLNNPRWWATAKMAAFCFSSMPFQVLYYRSQRLPFILNRLLKENEYDAAHMVLTRMMEYTPCLSSLPIVVDHVDSLSLNIKRRYQNEKSFYKKTLFGWEWMKLRRFEQSMKEQGDKTLLTSQIDADAGQFPRTSIVSIGVDTEKFSPRNSALDIDVLFTGNMSYFPNVNAAHYFCDRILPKLKDEKPDLKFSIAGVNPASSVQALHDGKTILVTGFVNDMAAHLNRAKVYAAPMRSGSGVQFKILEAMSCGLPVVTTSLGNEGIDAIDGSHLFIADHPDEFASLIKHLLKDRILRQQLGLAAREFVREKYSWSAQASKLEQAYRDAIAFKRSPLSYWVMETCPSNDLQPVNWS